MRSIKCSESILYRVNTDESFKACLNNLDEGGNDADDEDESESESDFDGDGDSDDASDESSGGDIEPLDLDADVVGRRLLQQQTQSIGHSGGQTVGVLAGQVGTFVNDNNHNVNHVNGRGGGGGNSGGPRLAVWDFRQDKSVVRRIEVRRLKGDVRFWVCYDEVDG
ncbi:hypothetical protein HDU76_001118 [Blyttiomyces sp. JEL0837]|nr:hypothetical protein HDU76_001118 [Blyttiomyces sp. JEL0837]